MSNPVTVGNVDARAWLCPFWIVSAGKRSTVVRVLNPNPESAMVIVRLYDNVGNERRDMTMAQDAPPFGVVEWSFSAFPAAEGWIQVYSPRVRVLPYGFVELRHVLVQGRTPEPEVIAMPLTFYPSDTILRPEDYRPSRSLEQAARDEAAAGKRPAPGGGAPKRARTKRKA